MGGQEFKALLHYTASLRPTCTTGDPNRKGGRGRDGGEGGRRKGRKEFSRVNLNGLENT